MLTLKDKTFVPLIDQKTLENRVAELALQIDLDYKGKEPLLVVVLNGAFIFAADLMKNLTVPCRVTFVRVSSYDQTHSTGKIKEVLGLHGSLKDQDVILIEDIVDTGLTIQEVSRQLREQEPASLEIATLLFKPAALKTPIPLKYVGFEIENQFVVGYGLDYDELGRNTKDLLVLWES